MANDPSPPPRTGLSLYANLLDPEKSAPGTISGAPVTYNRPTESSPEQDEAAKKQQALAASLRFQPTKRPQLAAQKAKAKAIASKLAQLPKPAAEVPGSQSEVRDGPPQEKPSAAAVLQKSTAADWVATASDDEDVNNFYAGTRQRGGRKKRKKNKESAHNQQHDWDDIYDPSQPNSYEEYKNSDEKIREVREWKDLLYRHRIARRRSSDYDSSSDRSERRPINRQFAPPSSMSFAPPKEYSTENSPPPPPPADEDDEYVPPAAAATVPNDATGEDAFARRMRLSQMQSQPPPPPPPPTEEQSVPVAPFSQSSNVSHFESLRGSQISRAPVRYNLPAANPDIPSSEAELEAQMEVEETGSGSGTPATDEDQARSTRPGQAKFAERLMARYGWSKGQGLGKEGTGVTSALYAKVDKRKKKSDAEGGGFVTPTAIGRIFGGTKSKEGQVAEEGKFGAMSEVARLEGMLNGMDVEEEMLNGEGGIMQEIGEECAEKYGNVERVYIHTATQSEGGPLVFVRFTSQLSALRAVNALEGRVFSGNEIKAKFWDREKFDSGVYE